MAKRKRSTALFEVISNSRQYRPARPATGRTGSWFSHAAKWFSRPKFTPLVSADKLHSKPIVAAQEMEYDEPAAPAAQEIAFAEPVHEEPPEEIVAAVPVVTAETLPLAPELKPEAEGTPRRFDLKWSYGNVAIAALAVMLVGGVTIVIGHRLTRASTPLLAETTSEELRKGPAHREVLELPRHGTVGPGVVVHSEAKPAARLASSIETVGAPAAQVGADKTKRYVTYNYVMIQSYPEEEAEMAQKAAAFLNAKGVACTIEHEVRGFLKVSVVGLDGFARISSPEFKAYVEHIKTLSGEFTKGAHSYKGFDPRAKKWDRPN